MTYGLVARCPRTGRLGIAVASYSIAIGLYCGDAARANTGATITLGYPNPGNNALALRLLAQGFTPRLALSELIKNDPDADYRQICVIDREGDVAAHTGAMTRGWSGHRVGTNGRGHVAFGEMLAGQQVADAISAGYGADPAADLEERLLAALEAGRDAGGQVGRAEALPARSALVIVQGIFDYSDWDLRVDMHSEAVGELRRVHEEYKPNAAYYVQRALNPRNAIPAMEFADMLAAKPTKGTT
jgi:uncharacterized Ntn-hydrolase superfamily protein